jgi:hypothetical protein
MHSHLKGFIVYCPKFAMATNEHPESYGWWINELESLGVTDAKRFDELDNDKAELKDVAENTKEMMLQQYEIAYGRQIHNNSVQKKVR